MFYLRAELSGWIGRPNIIDLIIGRHFIRLFGGFWPRAWHARCYIKVCRASQKKERWEAR